MMKRNQTLFPLRYGRGTQKVSLYAPTTVLPYYRFGSLYRMGGKRLQRTFTSLEKAKQEYIGQQPSTGKLASGEVTVAEVTASEVVQLRSAQE